MKSELVIKEKEEKDGENTEVAGIREGGVLLGAAGESGRSEVRSKTDSLFFLNRIEREWLSTEEAAHFLSISENALRIMVHRDQIRAFKMGRRLRFRVQDCKGLILKKGE